MSDNIQDIMGEEQNSQEANVFNTEELNLAAIISGEQPDCLNGYLIDVESGKEGLLKYNKRCICLVATNRLNESFFVRLPNALARMTKNAFDSNSRTTFIVPDLEDIGEIVQVDIWHCTGNGILWSCRKIVLKSLISHLTAILEVNSILTNNETFTGKPTMTSENNLKCSGITFENLAGTTINARYDFTTKGISKPESSPTDRTLRPLLHVRLIDKDESTGNLKLTCKVKEIRRLDSLTKTTYVLPKVSSIRNKIERLVLSVELDNQCSSWFLKTLIISDVAKSSTLQFDLRRTFYNTNSQRSSIYTLNLETDCSFIQSISALALVHFHVPSDKDDILYKITLDTLECSWFGSTRIVRVYMGIYGKSKNCDSIVLMQTSDGSPPFEPQTKSAFDLYLPVLGEIEYIKLWHDGSQNDFIVFGEMQISIPDTGLIKTYKINRSVYNRSSNGYNLIVVRDTNLVE